MKKTNFYLLMSAVFLLSGCAASDWQVVQPDQLRSDVELEGASPGKVMMLYYFEPGAEDATPLTVEVEIDQQSEE